MVLVISCGMSHIFVWCHVAGFTAGVMSSVMSYVRPDVIRRTMECVLKLCCGAFQIAPHDIYHGVMVSYTFIPIDQGAIKDVFAQ